ncbi:diguanylate cyclase domain-containing protein [Aliikangiella sp. IMCC44653]
MRNTDNLTETIKNEWVSRSDGLASNQIHSIAYLKETLWLATPVGLVNFDGVRFTTFSQSSGLLTHGLRKLVKSNDDLWVCSDQGVDLFSVEKTQVKQSLSTVAFGLGWCQGIAAIGQNQFLIACAKGLRRWNSQTNAIEVLGSPLDNEFIVSVEALTNGAALIEASESGIWLYIKGTLEPLAIDSISHHDTVKRFCINESGVWLITNESVIQLDFNLSFKNRLSIPHNMTNLKLVYPVSESELLYVTKESIVKITGDASNSQKRLLVQSDIEVNQIATDKFGNLWVATDTSGLLKYSQLNHYVKSFSGNKQNSVLSIRQVQLRETARSNFVHLANGQSISLANSDVFPNYYLVGGSNKSYLAAVSQIEKSVEFSSLQNIACWDLVSDPHYGFWAATSEGLCFIEEVVSPQCKIFVDANVGNGRCIAFYETDKMLYGSVSGLFIFDLELKKFTPLFSSNNNSLGYVYSIKKASRHLYYVCTLGNGLWRVDVHSLTLSRVHLDAGLTNVYSVDTNSNGDLACVVNDKLVVISEQVRETITTGTETVCAWQCLWFDNTRLLLATPTGLKLFNVKEKRSEFLMDRFPQNAVWEFTTARSLLLNDKNVLCGLNNGFKSVALKSLLNKVEAPYPKVKSIRSNAKFVNKENHIQLTEGDWTLNILLDCNWLWLEKTIRLEYRLNGLQTNWQSVAENQITFTTLPAGSYHLEVRLSNSLKIASTHYLVLAIEVNSRSLWYNTLCLIPKLFSQSISHFRRLGSLIKLTEQYGHLERQVEQRTQELVEANQKLLQLNSELNTLANRDKLNSVSNLRYFFEFIDNSLSVAAKNELQVCVMLVDVDNLAKYSENYGHLATTASLDKIKKVLNKVVNKNGCSLAQLDGQEFVVFSPETTQDMAIAIATRCIQAVKGLKILHEYSSAGDYLSISIGLCIESVEPNSLNKKLNELRHQLINRADDALYFAKKSGGNQFIQYTLENKST